MSQGCDRVNLCAMSSLPPGPLPAAGAAAVPEGLTAPAAVALLDDPQEWPAFGRPLQPWRGRRRARLGIARRAGRHALRRLRADHRGGAAPRAGRAAGRGQRRHLPRARRLGPRPGLALRLDGGRAPGGLPAAASPGRLCPRAPPARAPPRPVALAGGGLLHDAGHDVRLAGLPGHARRPDAGDGAAAALGVLGHQPAGGALCLRAFLRQRLARHPAAPRQHGPAGGGRHADHLLRQHGGHLRPRRAVRARGLLRLADHVRVLPAHRPLAGAAPARAHGRRAGGGDEPPARQHRAPGPGRQLCARGRAAPAAGRRGARAAGRGLPGRRLHPGRQHAGRRGLAHRRIPAGGQAPGARP